MIKIIVLILILPVYLQYLLDHHFKVISLRDLNSYMNVDEAIRTIVPDLNKALKN